MHVLACTDKGYTTINLLEEEKEEKTLSYLNSGGLVVYADVSVQAHAGRNPEATGAADGLTHQTCGMMSCGGAADRRWTDETGP